GCVCCVGCELGNEKIFRCVLAECLCSDGLKADMNRKKMLLTVLGLKAGMNRKANIWCICSQRRR
ncbi:hypothetical protein DPMN_157458, partial [Dreissena polymorpha]